MKADDQELAILKQTMRELNQFKKELKTLIDERESEIDTNETGSRKNVKLGAISFKKQLSKVITATGKFGRYYYKRK